MKFCRITMLILTVFLLGLPMVAGAQLPPAPSVCLECHDNVDVEAYKNSVHGQNSCTSCHIDLVNIDAHMEGDLEVHPVQCSRCHKGVAEQFATSVHKQNDMGCTDCHSDIHALQSLKTSKEVIVEKCAECHDASQYENSVHGQGVAAGNEDAPSCADCHGVHDVKQLSNNPNSKAAATFRIEPCIKCHEDKEMMERNGVNPDAVETYLDSYHGKNYRLGYPERVAGCASCHTAHDILPPSNPESSIGEEKIANTCAQCHPHASPLFSMFYAHGNHSDRENYPIMYYTFIAMTTLLVSTFAVFWIHTLMWMFRGLAENREKKALLAQGHVPHHVPEAHKIYRRFQKRHIFLHLTVIISFLGLSLTGLPLKFAGEPWAQKMMSFYGGTANAGLIHRACAILTFYYFISAILLSIDFLFVRKDIKDGFLMRLFGPDSLMPNFRDVRDVVNMVRWFLFKGPKPTFERWTYWEKFDFLAVFWGMFAIGGSGLLLWFPEFFGSFLPGWMFNVATIVHSDEALLATGFIFTVHFFNTHGRPEKFPMDFVIFNGEMTKEEFVEERGDQWKRYEEEGITESFVVEKPSGVIYDFFFKGFGFTAFFTGIALALLMFYAFMGG